MRSLLIAATTCGACLMIQSDKAPAPRVVWNASPSAPIGLYLIVRAPPRLGDLVLVRLPPEHAKIAHDRGYMPRSGLLLKTAAAGPGTRICRFGRRVLIVPGIVLHAHARDPAGRPLPRWSGCQRLGAGALLLIGSESRSFDSRYFGPIAAEHVAGRAIPIWIIQTSKTKSAHPKADLVRCMQGCEHHSFRDKASPVLTSKSSLNEALH